MIHKSEGAQASKTRANSHLEGSGGMLFQENLEFSTLREVFEAFLAVVLVLLCN